MSYKTLLRLLLLGLVVGIFILGTTVLDVGQLFRSMRQGFESLGWVGPVLFALVYGVLGALAAPTGFIELIAGAIFGFWIGGLAVLAGALMAANAGFVCGRWLARGWVLKTVARNRTAAQISTAVEQRGFWITVLIRLSPAVPFNLTSYVLGASTIRWLTFLAASLLGMIPIKCFMVWLGASGQKLLGATHPAAWGANEWMIYGGGTIVTLGVIALIAWTISRTATSVLHNAGDLAGNQAGDNSA